MDENGCLETPPHTHTHAQTEKNYPESIICLSDPPLSERERNRERERKRERGRAEGKRVI